MRHETLIFGLLIFVCYALALLTSALFVRWILPQRFKAELGNGQRYIAIDGIRGYLAFAVYLHHCLVTFIYLRTGFWGNPSLHFENELGKASVSIFFMITAFLFWGRVWAKRDLNVKSFFVSRLFRIYPLYLSVVLFVCIAIGFKSHWKAYEPTAALTSNIAQWLLFFAPNINHYQGTILIVAGVTWTLLYEALFYIFLPVLTWAFVKNSRIWKWFIAVAALIIIFRFGPFSWRIAATFLGGGIAIWWRQASNRVRWGQSKLAALIAIACVLAVFVFLANPFEPLGVALLSVFFAIIASGNTLFGVLRWRSALWLGEISYSIYLCHGIWLWIVVHNMLVRHHFFHITTSWLAIVTIGVTPLVVLFSSASYLFIERPFIDKGHALSKRIKPQTSTGSRILSEAPATTRT